MLRNLQNYSAAALLAAILSAPVLAKSTGSNAIFAQQLHTSMLANRVNGAVATVVLAAAVLAHAAAPTVFALDTSSTMFANATTTTVLTKTLQSPVLANVLSRAVSPFDITLISAAAASFLLVRPMEIRKVAEHSSGADQGADGEIFFNGIRR